MLFARRGVRDTRLLRAEVDPADVDPAEADQPDVAAVDANEHHN